MSRSGACGEGVVLESKYSPTGNVVTAGPSTNTVSSTTTMSAGKMRSARAAV